MRGREHEALDVALTERLDRRLLHVGPVVGVDDPGVVADGAQHVLDPPHDGREQRIGQVGDHQADAGRPRSLEAAGDWIGRVAHLGGDLLDSGCRFGVDQTLGLLVQGARSGGRMDTGHDRNLTQRGPVHRPPLPFSAAIGCSVPSMMACPPAHVQYIRCPRRRRSWRTRAAHVRGSFRGRPPRASSATRRHHVEIRARAVPTPQVDQGLDRGFVDPSIGDQTVGADRAGTRGAPGLAAVANPSNRPAASRTSPCRPPATTSSSGVDHRLRQTFSRTGDFGVVGRHRRHDGAEIGTDVRDRADDTAPGCGRPQLVARIEDGGRARSLRQRLGAARGRPQRLDL